MPLIHMLVTAASIFLVVGCREKHTQSKDFQNLQTDEIKVLRKRIQKVENILAETNLQISKNDIKNQIGPIKSLTFRIGTKDDRLRIYWANESRSDLPCTKEQSIWVCG